MSERTRRRVERLEAQAGEPSALSIFVHFAGRPPLEDVPEDAQVFEVVFVKPEPEVAT
ncbi:hypothetical protein KJ059_00545 [Myxococcota bacterium]|nr:hypothetical protein [Myxococcota bacterium]